MGRPRKYTEEERKELARKRAKDLYIKRDKRICKIDDPRYNMFSNAKKRAKEFDLPFNIRIEDILIPEICPLLGIPP